jgi:hypothetical protein
VWEGLREEKQDHRDNRFKRVSDFGLISNSTCEIEWVGVTASYEGD